jgi:hypothetical protein
MMLKTFCRKIGITGAFESALDAVALTLLSYAKAEKEVNMRFTVIVNSHTGGYEWRAEKYSDLHPASDSAKEGIKLLKEHPELIEQFKKHIDASRAENVEGGK